MDGFFRNILEIFPCQEKKLFQSEIESTSGENEMNITKLTGWTQKLVTKTEHH